MPEAFETIATRQRSELLFETPGTPLGPGICILTPVRLVAGFSVVGILGSSTQPFSVSVEEGCQAAGPFTQTQAAFMSSLDPATFLQFVCVRVPPCASHMRLRVCNTSATPAPVDVCGTGIPKAASLEVAAGTQGPQGPGTGFQGPQGPQGFQGPQGPESFQGPQGPQSFQGPQGDVGPQGPDGFQGPQGPESFQGPQGDIGPQGPDGFQGPQGPESFQGPQGDAGTQGPQGFQGAQGPESFQGPQGDAGTQGPQGFQGPQGPQSFQGPQGPQSFQGPQGPQGFQGIQGPQSFQGPQGDIGPQGSAGSVAGIIPYSAGSSGDLPNSATLALGFGNSNNLATGNESQSCFSCPRAGTIANLAVNVPVNGLTSGSTVIVIRLSATCDGAFADTTLKVTVAASTTGCFTSANTQAVAINDRISLTVTTGGSGAQTIRLSAGVEYQ